MLDDNKIGLFYVNNMGLAQFSNYGSGATAVVDTGESGMYLTSNSHHIHPNEQAPTIKVALPNGEKLESSQECMLDIHALPEESHKEHIIPGLMNSSLISIGQLCDEDCITTFNKRTVTIAKDNQIIMTGMQDHRTKLWNRPLRSLHHLIHSSRKCVYGGDFLY